MRFRLHACTLIVLVGSLASLALGCNPKIGDDCSTSTDCSTNGDRLCDTTQPGGYCTMFNCEPDTCPEEAQCIAFDSTLSPVCPDRVSARFERTYCMRRCESNGDCRGGYECADMAVVPNVWGASIIDFAPTGTQVCIATGASGALQAGENAVCGPHEGGMSHWPDAGVAPEPYDAGADVSHDSSRDSAHDATHDVPSTDSPSESTDAPADSLVDVKLDT